MLIMVGVRDSFQRLLYLSVTVSIGLMIVIQLKRLLRLPKWNIFWVLPAISVCSLRGTSIQRIPTLREELLQAEMLYTSIPSIITSLLQVTMLPQYRFYKQIIIMAEQISPILSWAEQSFRILLPLVLHSWVDRLRLKQMTCTSGLLYMMILTLVQILIMMTAEVLLMAAIILITEQALPRVLSFTKETD